MKQRIDARIIENTQTNEGLFRLRLDAPEIAKTAIPGQFVNIYPDESSLLLPRPLGIADADGDEITFYYIVIGAGTKSISKKNAGATLSILGPNGNGYNLNAITGDTILAAGGGGVPPLLFAAKRLREKRAGKIISVAGFREAPFLLKELEKYSDAVCPISETLTLENGLPAETGNIIDLLNRMEIGGLSGGLSCLACGPGLMLRALSSWCAVQGIPLQISMEERMGCGFGACVGCSIDTTKGKKKVCSDGPIFNSDEVIWT
jgi:dihydroorotate dehydrogenase electron transfer subunit